MDGNTVLVLLAVAAVVLFLNTNDISIVQGNSMEPTFSGCTLVVIDKNAEIEEVEIGQIVVVDISEADLEFNKFAHRLVEIKSSQAVFSTRGDNDELYDFPSSVDGFFEFEKFLGTVEIFFGVPNSFCN